MKTSKPKYPIHQCALYKCKSKKKLESLLTIEPGNLKNIQHTIKYHSFDIYKKNSDEKRRITAPKRTLKAVQKRTLSLLQYIERPSWLISGEKGKCYIDNGVAHLNANYMLAVDIKKFYDNCRRNSVYLFFANRMHTSPDVAEILTDIVTHNNGIPTGCPTSQLIAYYAYEDMFKQISRCAESYGCRFTLYVDDMTFSSSESFAWQRLAREVDIILRRFGHRPKYSKVKFYSKDTAKPITGTIVTPNHDLDVPNSLQKKVYDNFQSLKVLDEQGKMEEAARTKQKLIGQIQASRNIDDGRFPEISRITNAISTESSPSTKPATRSVCSKKTRIKIKVPINQ